MGKLGLKPPSSTPEKKDIREYHPTSYAEQAQIGEVLIPGNKIHQVACGFHHTVCLTQSGDVYAWGKGKEGALGLKQWTNQLQPKKVCFFVISFLFFRCVSFWILWDFGVLG